MPVQFDADTLDDGRRRLRARPGSSRPPTRTSTAATGGMLNYAAKLGPRSSYRFFLLAPGRATKPQMIALAAGHASRPTCTPSG